MSLNIEQKESIHNAFSKEMDELKKLPAVEALILLKSIRDDKIYNDNIEKTKDSSIVNSFRNILNHQDSDNKGCPWLEGQNNDTTSPMTHEDIIVYMNQIIDEQIEFYNKSSK